MNGQRPAGKIVIYKKGRAVTLKLFQCLVLLEMLHSVKTTFTILNHTCKWCEQEDIYQYHIACILEILDDKIKGLTLGVRQIPPPA